MVTIQCEICGREFYVSPSREETARFCSKACYGKWQSKYACGENAQNWQGGKVKLTCMQCGETYAKYPAAAEGSHFCSRKCCDKWKSENKGKENSQYWIDRVTSYCEYCGEPFQVLPSEATKRRFCSLACAGRWQSLHNIGSANPFWKGGKVTLLCKTCGRPFQCDQFERDTACFCSRSCAAKSRIGIRAANWQGGKSFEPYPLEFNKEFKQAIRERDDYTCAVCKLKGNNVHHINYVKNDTIPENCITLCKSCHAVTNMERAYWREKLGGMRKLQKEYEAYIKANAAPV